MTTVSSRIPSFLLALLFAFPFAAKAAEFRVGQRVTIPAGQTISGNLYVAAGEAALSGNVAGDLVCAGGNVFLAGTVSEDVVVGGGDLTVQGRVGKDLRLAAGRVSLSGQVGGDFVVAGGQVRILSGATIGGDLVVAGGEVILEGAVRGAVRAAGGEITINDAVTGPVRVRATSLTIGERARLGGELTYWAPREAAIHPGAQLGGPVTFNMIAGMDRDWLGSVVRRLGIAVLFLTLLMSLAGGLLGVLIFRKPSEELVRHTLHNFGRELLRGFLLFFAMPAVLFLVTLTVVGLPVAVIAGLAHVSFGIIAVIYAGIAFGSLLWKAVAKKEEYEATWKSALAGIPLLALMSLLPLLGIVVNAMFFLAVFGSLYQRFWLVVRAAVRPQP